MGIPSYFSYIVKNHLNIINKFIDTNLIINNLYIDSNSIIYDVVNNLDYSLYNNDDNFIINNVIHNIEKLIFFIKPNDTIFIAFDGVAPLAKIEQQRSRRFKSIYQSNIIKSINNNNISEKDNINNNFEPWNTTTITPGTLFMKYLNEKIKYHFSNYSKYNVKNIIFSGSNEVGEGEHKLFQYIRNYPEFHFEKNTIIYGLDADLIMLSIRHLSYCPNIYLLREAPHFIKSINIELEPNEFYLLNIYELSNIISLDMNNNNEINTLQHNIIISDYIFLCFFLGNDFMPHFPSLNIRTGGIDKMILAYKEIISSNNIHLTDGKIIYWNNVRKLIEFLAKNEETYFKNEHKLRDRKEKNKLPDISIDDKIKQFNYIPSYERSVEKYINPFKINWQIRYYKSLFDIKNKDLNKEIKNISINFLEGLEWNFKYYNYECPDWRWCYNYNYPPLLCDLLNFIPNNNEYNFIKNNNNKPISEITQLCYVLPRHSLYLLPENLYKALLQYKIYLYKNDCEFDWAYCKYFWESHTNLPKININELEDFINLYISK
jgi:5'-3' exonuclease